MSRSLCLREWVSANDDDDGLMLKETPIVVAVTERYLLELDLVMI